MKFLEHVFTEISFVFIQNHDSSSQNMNFSRRFRSDRERRKLTHLSRKRIYLQRNRLFVFKHSTWRLLDVSRCDLKHDWKRKNEKIFYKLQSKRVFEQRSRESRESRQETRSQNRDMTLLDYLSNFSASRWEEKTKRSSSNSSRRINNQSEWDTERHLCRSVRIAR